MKRIMVDLYRDGTMIFAGQGDHQFLAWHDAEEQKINPMLHCDDTTDSYY